MGRTLYHFCISPIWTQLPFQLKWTLDIAIHTLRTILLFEDKCVYFYSKNILFWLYKYQKTYYYYYYTHTYVVAPLKIYLFHVHIQPDRNKDRSWLSFRYLFWSTLFMVEHDQNVFYYFIIIIVLIKQWLLSICIWSNISLCKKIIKFQLFIRR